MVCGGFYHPILLLPIALVAQASGVLLAAVLLWDVLFRSQPRRVFGFFRRDVFTQSWTLVCQPITPLTTDLRPLGHQFHAHAHGVEGAA